MAPLSPLQNFRCDPETLRDLRVIHEAHGGNRSEAVRRAIREAAARLREEKRAA